MHKIDTAGNVANLFSEGDPGLGLQPTVVGEDWLNAVQTELVNVVLGAGLALSKPDNTQVLTAIQALIAGYNKGYKREFSLTPYSTLATFLAGAYISMGVCKSGAGEIVEAHHSGGATDSMLYSMVVNATAGCNCDVIVPCYDDDVLLYLDGVLKHTWTGPGESATPYTMVLSAGDHVVQFLNNNSTAGPADIFVNDWMAGNPVVWLRAAHS